MVKAVLKNGIFVPHDPLPEDWQEGTEVQVEKSAKSTIAENGVHPTDTWMDEVEALASAGDPGDDVRLEAAIAQIRWKAKDIMTIAAPRGAFAFWHEEGEDVYTAEDGR